jgi:hypothetical protein
MGSIALALIRRYFPQIIISIALICGYFAWKHHIEAVQHEKDMAEIERSSKELLQRKIVEVKIENDALHERKDNAIQIYAKRSADVERDAHALTERLSKRAGSCRNTVSGKVDDDGGTKGGSVEEDRSIALEIVSVLNACEFWINQIPVK